MSESKICTNRIYTQFFYFPVSDCHTDPGQTLLNHQTNRVEVVRKYRSTKRYRVEATVHRSPCRPHRVLSPLISYTSPHCNRSVPAGREAAARAERAVPLPLCGSIFGGVLDGRRRRRRLLWRCRDRRSPAAVAPFAAFLLSTFAISSFRFEGLAQHVALVARPVG